MSLLLNPFVFAAAGGDFESIATVTVGSGGASSIEFTSIPGTYQHLQLRGIVLNSAAGNWMGIIANGTTTGSLYASHSLYGTGSAAAAVGLSSRSSDSYYQGLVTSTTTYPFAFVIDALDYASTTKTKVFRTFWGQDGNATGTATDWRVGISSALFNSTSALTSVKLANFTFAEHSEVALYGIKA